MSFDLPHETGANWYLAQLKPNSARIAERNLSRQGIRTFLPLLARTAKRRGRFVEVKEPLFPGYIFVSFGEALARWRAVNSTYGVARLVSFGREPAPVPAELVAELQMRCDPSGVIQPEAQLRPGDRIAIRHGPFAGLIAEVTRISPDRRVWILLDIIGGRREVEISEAARVI